MKSLLITLSIMQISIFSIQAQQSSAGLSPLLYSYYEVKNALVSSDPSLAATKASQFITEISGTTLKTRQELQKKLAADAGYIAATKDISKQREYFAAFSQDFYELAKTVKLSDQPIYQAYCPMKKMYWLSSEVSIKNPYFGNAMLSCGSITATIKP